MEQPFDTKTENELSVQLPVPHSITHRRKIGAFYTPLSVTTALCEWGVRAKDDVIFEPCFGGCTFLEASIARLQELGQENPEKNLYGCDMDPLAFQYLKTRLAIETIPSHFAECDFLALFPEDTGHQLVDFVVGNPPYIRHSNFDVGQKKAVEFWQNRYGVRLNGRSSLWAYFIMHSLHFLKSGGRVAWVLPGSFLTAKYAAKVREDIAKKFVRVSVITLIERLFISEGTEELTIILLAEGFNMNESPASIETKCIDRLTGLKEFLVNWNTAESGCKREPMPFHIGSGMVPREALSLMAELSKDVRVETLGSLTTIQIGLVTGNAKYFIKSTEGWQSADIERKYLRYIVPRSRWVRGISLSEKDTHEHEVIGSPCLTLDCSDNTRAPSIQKYLDLYDKKELEKNSTFARRPLWYQFSDDKIPDAFLVFLTNLGPRLVVNKAKANCTNSLYRVYFKVPNTLKIKLVAISLNSTYTQLSAELLGHGRGSGALKLEPSDARRLYLFLPKNRTSKEINDTFAKIDKLLRLDKVDDARKLADNFLFCDSPHFIEALPTLSACLITGRNRRMRVIKLDD